MQGTRRIIAAAAICCITWLGALAQGGINCTLKGTVNDSISGEAVAFASVQLLTMGKDSIVTGCLTDEKGNFTMDGLRPGRYTLVVQFIGFKAKRFSPIALSPQEPVKVMGRMDIAPANIMLSDVQISDRKDLMLNSIDRKEYDVEKSLVSSGGGATDILRTLPSVEVDIDGNISLRGSPNVTVLIDGKPSAMTGAGRTAVLQQIPASSIKSIEVITNPSARYDPDGMSGIINIVTKKNKAQGLNGNLSLGAGTHRKYNGSLSMGYRGKHINAYGTYSLRQEDRWGKGTSETTTVADSISQVLSNHSLGNRSSTDHLVRAGMDIYLNPLTTLGLAGGWAAQRESSWDQTLFFESNPATDTSEVYSRPESGDEAMSAWDAEISLSQKFKKQARSLDARLAYSDSRNQEFSSFSTHHLLTAGQIDLSPPDEQTNEQIDAIRLGTFQLDYLDKIGTKNRIEAGVKATSRDIGNDFTSETLDKISGEFLNDSLISNALDYKERIIAGYAIHQRAWGTRFTTQVGLRAEQAFTEAIPAQRRQSFTNDYFKLYPSAYLSYKPKANTELRLSYSRRINRPTTDQLNPFTNYSNPKRLRVGNPELLPELIDALELNLSQRLKFGTITATGYFRYIHDAHTRYFEPIAPGSDTIIATFVNLLSGKNLGLELIAQFRPAKWMDLMVSGNFFRTVMDASNLEPDLTVNNVGLTSNLNATFYLSKETSLQLTANYSTPRVGPQGTFAEMFATDIAFKQNLLKGRASVNLRLTDVTNTRRFKILANTSELYGFYYRKRESRIGYVTLSYRLGSGDVSVRRRRNQEERTGGGEMDF